MGGTVALLSSRLLVKLGYRKRAVKKRPETCGSKTTPIIGIESVSIAQIAIKWL